MIRLGLCCLFSKEDINFRTTTAARLSQLPGDEAGKLISEICMHNAASLMSSLVFCAQNAIGDFRVSSDLLPLVTHPEYGYSISQLPGGAKIKKALNECGEFARSGNIRTTLHPDQFVVLNSPKPEVVANSIADLKYHAELASMIGADVITVHGGGGYGDKQGALKRLVDGIKAISKSVRRYIAFENDDRVFTPSDLVPICRATGIPLVYDVHHHRCLPDILSVEQASEEAMATWDREPVFHVSSPIYGWDEPGTAKHAEYINPDDFPVEWKRYSITVEVEAKAKELAVIQLRRDLLDRGYAVAPGTIKS